MNYVYDCLILYYYLKIHVSITKKIKFIDKILPIKITLNIKGYNFKSRLYKWLYLKHFYPT